MAVSSIAVVECKVRAAAHTHTQHTLTAQPCPRVRVRLDPVPVPPSGAWTHSGAVTVGPLASTHPAGQYTGVVRLAYACQGVPLNRTLDIPLSFELVVSGGRAACPDMLALQPGPTSYFVGQLPFRPQTRTYTLYNAFSVPMKIFSVRFANDAEGLFTVLVYSVFILF